MSSDVRLCVQSTFLHIVNNYNDEETQNRSRSAPALMRWARFSQNAIQHRHSERVEEYTNALFARAASLVSQKSPCSRAVPTGCILASDDHDTFSTSYHLDSSDLASQASSSLEPPVQTEQTLNRSYEEPNGEHQAYSNIRQQQQQQQQQQLQIRNSEITCVAMPQDATNQEGRLAPVNRMAKRREVRKRRSALSAREEALSRIIQQQEQLELAATSLDWQHLELAEPVNFDATEEEKALMIEARVTTLMLCDMPCRILDEEVIAALDSNGFAGQYDSIRVPCCGQKLSNLGYAFINFIDTHTALRFRDKFHGYRFPQSRSHKACRVKAARMQGFLATPTKSSYRRKPPTKLGTCLQQQK
jgi:hypothetical protein